jgi:hypothetical protein
VNNVKRQEHTRGPSHAPSPLYRSLRRFGFGHGWIRLARGRSCSLLPPRPPLGLSRQLPIRDPPAVHGGRFRHRCHLRNQSAPRLRAPATGPVLTEIRCRPASSRTVRSGNARLRLSSASCWYARLGWKSANYLDVALQSSCRRLSAKQWPP